MSDYMFTFTKKELEEGPGAYRRDLRAFPQNGHQYRDLCDQLLWGSHDVAIRRWPAYFLPNSTWPRA
jgi:hypothetical protein